MTRRQMMAALLAGAAPGGASDNDQPDEDALPIPESGPAPPPLVNPPPPKGYSPPYGPPPYPQPRSNMLAMALGGAAPAAAAPPPLASALASNPAITPNYAASPEQLPPAAHYAKLPGPPLLLAGNDAGAAPAAPSPRTTGPQQGLPAASVGTTVPGEDETTTRYRTEHDAAMTQFNALLAKGDAANSANNSEAAKIYYAEATKAFDRANVVNDKAIEYLKPLKTVTPGQNVYNPASGQYEQPVPESPYIKVLTDEQKTPEEREAGGEFTLNTKTGERAQIAATAPDKTRAPTDEEKARAVAAGLNPNAIQVASGKIESMKGPDTIDMQNWKAENADNAARGLPERAFKDFLSDKKAYGSASSSNIILGKDGNPIDENLTGDAVYAAVPGTVARMGRGMADGTIKIPTLGVRTDPTAKQAFLVAQQADQSLVDTNKVAARREIEAGYSKSTPGSLGGQVNAGNTAADHLADVVEAADDLKNASGGGVPLIAHIANNLRNNITTAQSGKAGALEDGLLHYGEEIAKFYAGAQTGEAERLRFLSALGACKSPEEMAGVFRMEARQLGGKFVTLDEQVRSVMGDQGAAKYPVVRASSKENARRITAGLAALDPTGAEAAGVRSPTDIWPGVGPQQRAAQAQTAPRNVAPGVTGAPPAAPQGPPPGFIKGGYRFKGGDPGQKSNWEAAQ